MKNYIQNGATLTFTSATAVTSGQGILMGDLFGVAAVSAQANEEFSATLVGVFDLPKAVENITAGVKVYWDNGAGNLTTTDTGNTLVGAAVQAADSAATTLRVRLNGIAV